MMVEVPRLGRKALERSRKVSEDCWGPVEWLEGGTLGGEVVGW